MKPVMFGAAILISALLLAQDSGFHQGRGQAGGHAGGPRQGLHGIRGALAKLASSVGFHWFEYRDEPAEGRRLDGENGNYGVVKIDFTPWDVLTRQMTKVNAGIEALHATAPVN